MTFRKREDTGKMKEDRWHSGENSLWKRHIWTCSKTDNEMNE